MLAAETPAFKGFDVVSWSGHFAPARTPAAVQRSRREADEVLRTDAVRDTLVHGGVFPGGGTAEDFGSFAGQDWAKIDRILRVMWLRD